MMHAMLKTKGRKAVTRSISIDPEMEEKIEKRLEELKPRVRGLSHYIQLLVERDMLVAAKDTKAATAIEEWCAVKELDLRPPPCQGDDVALKLNGSAVDFAGHAMHPLPDVLPFSGGQKFPLSELPAAA